MSGQQGFSLVELVVAMTLLTISLVGLAGAAAVAQRTFSGTEAMEMGTDAAALVLDSLMREHAPADGARRIGAAAARWSVVHDSVATAISLTISIDDGGRARELSFYATHHAK
jgi:prepilin-type N-terminal cleavage/methylation domain-containing protein